MLRNLLITVLVTGTLVATSGCYSTQEGRVRAGVPFVKDTIVSRYELPMDQVHAAALEVLKTNGTLTSDDVVKKLVVGVVDGSQVWISFDDSAKGITAISIQARTKGGGADVSMASEIDKLIYGVLIRR